jgi:hypothetical protein
VAGQAVPHGYVIEIEDRGLGMSDEELIQANERLANPPEIDFALSRVLGLYVVGRLGQRHGIKVQLRHSWYGGVTALTLLPHALLVWPKAPQAIPEPVQAVVPGRAELPPPQPPDGAGRARAPEPQPAPSGDHLPIFEAARSDWFVTEPAEPAPLPLRQRQNARAGDGNGPAPDRGGPPPAPPAGTEVGDDPRRPFRPAPVAPAEAPRPYRPEPPRPEPVRADEDEAPLYQAERARLREQPPPVPPAPPPAAAPMTAAAPAEEPAYRPAPYGEAAPPPPPPAPAPAAEAAERLTQAGLPRRVPKANLAPGMAAAQQAADQAGGEGAPSQPVGRSPDEVRSMLSSYRTGIERGRTVAGGANPGERPPDAP